MAGSAEIVVPTVVHDEKVAVCSVASVSSIGSFVTNARVLHTWATKRKGEVFC